MLNNKHLWIIYIYIVLAQHVSMEDTPCDETYSAADPTPTVLMQLDLFELMSLSGGVWDRDVSLTWEPVLTTDMTEKADATEATAVCV